MLMWPAVAALGFFAMTGLVIALATSSTARYDFERNRAHEAPALDRSSATASDGPRPSGRRPQDAPRSRRAAARQPSPRRASAGLATHPAGRRLAEEDPATGWWLVDERMVEGAPARAVAGPFAERLEAEWAALAGAATGRVVHGRRTVTGALLLTPTPQEGAWMLELGQQLARLGDDWFDLVSDTDPLTTLVVELAEALIEAGLPLHDCSAPGSLGGVCLTPYAESGGILVSWHGHERMTLLQLHGAELDAAVRRTMSAAAADVLAQRGFDVRPLGRGCGHLVMSARR